MLKRVTLAVIFPIHSWTNAVTIVILRDFSGALDSLYLALRKCSLSPKESLGGGQESRAGDLAQVPGVYVFI